MIFNNRQTAAILAGLEVLDQERRVFAGEDIEEILTDGGRFEPLTCIEIGKLIEAINCDDAVIVEVTPAMVREEAQHLIGIGVKVVADVPYTDTVDAVALSLRENIFDEIRYHLTQEA